MRCPDCLQFFPPLLNRTRVRQSWWSFVLQDFAPRTWFLPLWILLVRWSPPQTRRDEIGAQMQFKCCKSIRRVQLRVNWRFLNPSSKTAGETFFCLWSTRSLFERDFQAQLFLRHVFGEPLNASLPELTSWHDMPWHAMTCHDTTPFFGDLPKPRKPAQAKTWNSIKLQSSTQRKETLAVQPEVPHLEKPHATSNQQMHPKESHALTQKDPSHLPPNCAQTYDMHRPALPKLFG